VKKTRVLVADDHELVRRGVLASLQQAQADWEVCGEAATGRDAVAKATSLKPDIVVMDISMPEMNGLEATRQILKDSPEIQVLILSMHESEHLVHEVLASGARGYVLKADAGNDLIAAMNALRQHKVFFTSRISELVLRGYLAETSPERGGTAHAGQLSPRESEILQLVAEGKSNKDVANTLNLSVKTVETHRARIMDKLDLHTVSDLIRYAVRNQIIEV
jgi:DNA-binding NarL/FixJ family response regulator